ncbi:MAG: hypothetical protein ACXACX_05270 [Candidatus Hodarchaeales archaeon]|jgi:hypothetical protein
MTSKIPSLDKNTKLRLSFEEWIKNEFKILAKQQEDQEIAKNARFIAVDALILRKHKQVGVISYQFSEKNIWIIFCQPILRKLDSHSITHFLKIIIESIVELKKQDDKEDVRGAEIRAYNKIIKDLEKLSQSKNLLNQIERMKQAIFFLSTQFLKAGLPVVNPESLVPLKSDNELLEKISNAFQKIRIKLYSVVDPIQFEKVKFRILPFHFKIVMQNKDSHESELRVKPIITLDVYDYQGGYTFSLFLINTFFLETIDSANLEILLAYELISMINSRKYNRGEMERDIYNILSKERKTDENYEVLKGFYNRDLIDESRSKINSLIEEDLASKETPTLRIE